MARQQASVRYGSIALIIIAPILLFLAQSAYWVNHTVFNQASFTSITTTALLSESSRDAIATSIVDRSLQDRPVIKRLVGERIESLMSGLLGTDLSTQAVKALSNKTYAYVTAKNREDIKIELTGVKAPLAKIITLVQNDDSQLASLEAQIPDEIILIESDAFPDLSKTVQLMLWLGPLFWLGTVVLFGLYIYIGRDNYAKRVYIAGGTIVIVSVLGLLAAPAIPPPIAAAVPNIQLRPVVENLTTGFLAPFQTQMYYMLGGALLTLLIFSQRFNIFIGIKALETKLTNRSTTKKS